ncbi:MAG TPA: DUF1540 domain-containing protein [Anaerolineaceae bacterium]|jgi:hypothetical protein|nr:hypothetical protein [Anaerolineaceae bacterium]HNZ14414.1 DUF1540 domain-containing protein [Anaerolineaceae bacterium]HOH92140.1 DUF1540 domain-containing protein [Anaerolineaceae bacterium]HQN68609.1 DUF1540 domain-containing protein [Anaerolineaceae bacterium]
MAPRVRCHYNDCEFLDERYCSAAAIEINPDNGCLTYRPTEDISTVAGWDDDESLDDWEEITDEDDDDLWVSLDDEEDEDLDEDY